MARLLSSNSTGVSVFDLLRYRQHDGAAVLSAFDLIELDGKNLCPSPIEQRKDQLGKLLQSVRRSHTGITLNKHYEGDGATIYRHACIHSTASRVDLHLVWSDRMVCLEPWCSADSAFGLSMPADPMTSGASVVQAPPGSEGLRMPSGK